MGDDGWRAIGLYGMDNIQSAFNRICGNLAVWKCAAYGFKVDLFWLLTGNFRINPHFGFFPAKKCNEVNGIVP